MSSRIAKTAPIALPSRIRFSKTRQVFATFVTATDDITAAPTDEPPLAFLRTLSMSPMPQDAVSFCAYLLPRREAVWWACQCVLALRGAAGGDRLSALAEAWVRDPEEERRREALDAALGADPAFATTWLALAAGWSGGSMAPAGTPPVPPPPHLTAKAVRAAILMALARVGPQERARWLVACVEAGIRFAEGGDARVRLGDAA